MTGVKRHAYAIAAAPFQRIIEAPEWARIVAFMGSVTTYLITDVFTTALLLVVVSGLVDYLLGVRLAKLRHAYEQDLAHAGFISKVSGVAIMMLVRMAEYWLMTANLVDTRGMIAAALTLSLFAVDLEGIQMKREQLGARPIPGLSAFTAWCNGLINRFLPSTPSLPVLDIRAQRESEDDDG